MSRSSVVLRDATAADAPALAELWHDVLRRADPAEQEADLVTLIGRLDPQSERLVVAEYDGEVAGAVMLKATTATPLNLEPLVQAVSPHVLPAYRRRGVGRALVEAAVVFAEERGIGHVGSGALSASRDANRFLARLGLGPQAVLRAGPTATVRSRLDALKPTKSRARQISQVLAVRRSQRHRDAAPAPKG
ncbi:GNAT family N-acetyltransferase [Nocardioides sp.]|uniref:GNAT family N-acetyltransferase n=1 Tax=Nocardioides sp. TaxID=35761 RepID=UPI0035284AE9